MLFGSKTKWWSEGKRNTPHEGIDICYFLNSSGEIEKIDPNISIPAIETGEVLGIVKDFLGYSIFVLSEIDGNKYVWAFGHMDLKKDLMSGRIVLKGEILGGISQAKNKKVPSHLHITMARLKAYPKQINWNTITDKAYFKLMDPLDVMSLDYELR